MSTIEVPANFYQQFDADFSLDVPGEGYGGWQKETIEISEAHTGFVVMHAWDAGSREDFPGWHRAVEYIPRAHAISQHIFPALLSAIRVSSFPLFHVVGGGDYYKTYPGYQKALDLAGAAPADLPRITSDQTLDQLRQFRAERVFTGTHNTPDVNRGLDRLDFTPEAKPLNDEGVAENSHQLFALCKAKNINHLIYMGFAINWCLLLSPGGMAEMQKYGIMCSAIRQAVTAVENKETARQELCKEIGLWRVALAFGFVFDIEDIIQMLEQHSRHP